MNADWEDQAENWLKWARTPGHDVYGDYSPSFFDEIVPASTGLTLEVGCGEGRVTRDLIARGHDVIALDPSRTLITHAALADEVPRYINGEGEHLPFPDSSFDLVVAYNSLQNVNDMPATIVEIARVLTPTGSLCICVAHPTSDAGRFQSEEPDAPFIMSGSYYGPRRVNEREAHDGLEMTFRGWAYSLEEYVRALEDNGFIIERLREPRIGQKGVERRPVNARWQRIPLFLLLRAAKQTG